MQYTGPVRAVNGSQFVEFLTQITLSGVSGTFAVDDGVTFTSGAEGVVASIDAGVYSIAVTTSQHPVVGDSVVSDGSPAASGTVATLVTAPALVTGGVAAGQLFFRQGDKVAYVITAVLSSSRLQLAALYGGASTFDASAAGVVHTTRTSNFDLPLMDREDLAIQIVFSAAMKKIDEILQDHEDRLP